ncbi:alpha/beta hydrolase, partial [Staphylococcus xylosus]
MKINKRKTKIYLTIVLIAFILFVIILIAAFKTYS